MNNYNDIIHLNRPASKHKKLSDDSRAAQFAPFAALNGYEEAVRETARITDKKIDINEEKKYILNEKLNYLNNHIKDKNIIEIIHFIKDSKKNGGKYIKTVGIIKRIDIVNEIIKLEDNTIIKMNDILDISSNIFENLY